MHTNHQTSGENMNAKNAPENAHFFAVDNYEIVDIDDLKILKDGFKASMGATVSLSPKNETYLVYVGY